MNREEAAKLLPIIKAFSEGKTLQSRCIKGDKSLWYDDDDPSFDDAFEYCIKPEPKYRPFKDAEECWTEMEKHQPFGWVKDKVSDEYFNVYCISNNNEGKELLERMFKRCVFIDKNPFGVKDEED